MEGSAVGLFGLTSSVMPFARGNNWHSNSSCLAVIWVYRMFSPVAFPPGRARLSTSPASTASLPTSNTIGIVEVATLAALAGGGPKAAIRSTPRPTSSDAIFGKRS